MSIRIRKPNTKTGSGRLSIYRNEYQPAHTVTGVRIPGHMRDAYVGSLPRFVDLDNAADAIIYREAAPDQPAPATLNDAEVKVLQGFLVKDAKNRMGTWPKVLVAEIRAQVEQEFDAERERIELQRGRIEPQDYFDLAANTLRGAALSVAARVTLYQEQGQKLADGWMREKFKTAAPGENALTRLKAEANNVRQAAVEFETALQAAGLVAKRPRANKIKGVV